MTGSTAPGTHSVPTAPGAPAGPPIESVEQLRAHLQTALQIEHATIPPYMAAWLTIDQRTNLDAWQTLRSVLLEEMLHLALVANVLNAVGGAPSLTHAGFVPVYPCTLPHSAGTFEVSVERFSLTALETFKRIEQPEAERHPPQPDRWTTLAQFYAAIQEAVDRLCDELGESQVFTGHLDRQMRPEDYYGSGRLVVVRDRQSARRALTEIVEQGEGAHHGVFDADRAIVGEGDGREPAHYFRFEELVVGCRYVEGDTPSTGPTGPAVAVDFDAVLPARANTAASSFPEGSDRRRVLDEFTAAYRQLLASLERSFLGERDQFVEATARMFAVHQLGLALARTPSGDGTTTLGLPFG